MKNQIVESGESKWLVRSAESMDDAMDAIAMARCTGSSGSKTVVNDTACGGTERVTADVVRVNPGDRLDEIDRLQALNAELVAALEVSEAQISGFYTATCTNAKSRDENRDAKQAALSVIRAALAKAKEAQS